jgi:hypothetical protein
MHNHQTGRQADRQMPDGKKAIKSHEIMHIMHSTWPATRGGVYTTKYFTLSTQRLSIKSTVQTN